MSTILSEHTDYTEPGLFPDVDRPYGYRIAFKKASDESYALTLSYRGETLLLHREKIASEADALTTLRDYLMVRLAAHHRFPGWEDACPDAMSPLPEESVEELAVLLTTFITEKIDSVSASAITLERLHEMHWDELDIDFINTIIKIVKDHYENDDEIRTSLMGRIRTLTLTITAPAYFVTYTPAKTEVKKVNVSERHSVGWAICGICPDDLEA